MDELKRLFEEKFGFSTVCVLIKGGGGSRKYYRLKNKGISAIGVEGDDIHENETFLNLDYVLRENGIEVPEVLKVSNDKRYYLLEDLGDDSLLDELKKLEGEGKSEEKLALASAALKELVKFQRLPASLWEKVVGYNDFSSRLVRWDLNYFKYDFLKPAHIAFDEEKLEDDFEKMIKEFSPSKMMEGLMYRDFQSRNVMVKDSELFMIDFQGARRGPIAYDAASFIWQAKAPFNFEEREQLGDAYIRMFAPQNIEDFRNQLQQMILFRTLQVLGAYGFRGLIEKKPHFIESIPFAIRNLKYRLEKGAMDKYPEISRIARELDESSFEIQKSLDGKLTVSVFSFSYKKGYPEDKSGNGGGFMFDCRALHNPGRYDEYKHLSGQDEEVIKFLETRGETKAFLNKAIDIVTPSIERYMARGFTSLQVGFGCTGGQHRSVYCAENFARKISELFPDAEIKLQHREMENWKR